MARRRGNGEGSIYQRQDGKYVAEVTIWDGSGKRRRVKRSARTKTEARQRLAELQELQKGGVDLLSGETPLSEYLDRWLQDSVKNRVRQKTYDNYASICRVRVVPRIGRVKLSKVTPAILLLVFESEWLPAWLPRAPPRIPPPCFSVFPK